MPIWRPIWPIYPKKGSKIALFDPFLGVYGPNGPIWPIYPQKGPKMALPGIDPWEDPSLGRPFPGASREPSPGASRK